MMIANFAKRRIADNDTRPDSAALKLLRRGALTLFAFAAAAAMLWAYTDLLSHSDALAQLPFALAFGVVFLAAGRGLSKMEEGSVQRLFFIALAGMLALYTGVSVWFMRVYRFAPVWDTAAVFHGAQNWLAGELTQGSTSTFDAQTYFYYFPNNLGATLVLRTWFALTRGMDAYLSACTLNMLLSVGMIACTAFAAREMAGARGGTLSLLALGCTLPLWFSCAAFYTDFLSMCFPAGALLFALLAEKQELLWKKALFWTLAGCMAALGALIKITVLIMPVALVLWQLLRAKWREALGLLLSCALLFGLGQTVLHRSVCPDQLDPQLAAQMNTPVQHWIMMGLEGFGFYNGEDYDFTRSFAHADEAKPALNERIAQRIAEKGPGGMLKHLVCKMGIAFSDGTLKLSDNYDDTPDGPLWLQEMLLPDGGAYPLWKAECGGAHLAQVALALAGCVGQIRRGGRRLSGALYLSLFGLLLFLSMWETNTRYWINFMPILALCAAEGADRLSVHTLFTE